MKRLILFSISIKNDIIQDYVIYYINALKEISQFVTVVIKGDFSNKIDMELKNLNVTTCYTGKINSNFNAWKVALEQENWKTVCSFDEVVFCDDSCYGPFSSLSIYFDKMNSSKCDFWGITKHPEVIINKKNKQEILIKEHIQTYFFVFKKSIVNSDIFKKWWSEINLEQYDKRNLEKYSDNVLSERNRINYKKFDKIDLNNDFIYEFNMTKYFETYGFISGSIMETDKYYSLMSNDDISLFYPLRLMNDGIPFIKRRIFINSESYCSSKCIGHIAVDMLNFIKKYTKYDEKLIWKDLLTNEKFSYIKDSLHLNFILSSHYSRYNSNIINCDIKKTYKKQKLALICYAYYEDLSDYMIKYILNMPEYSHIYIISSKNETLISYKNKIKELNFEKVEYRIKENRGRDVTGYLIAARDVLENYEIICCIHDKKSTQLHNKITAEEFLYFCMECTLCNKEYVQNILELFENNPICGLLVPPTPYFADFCTLGAEAWGNLKQMKKLHSLLHLSVPLDDECPVAPFGACFWVRGEAIKPLFRYNWKYSDFPEEPLGIDFTISHGIERMYPMIVQEAGFYTAWCSPDTYASIYMNKISYRIRNYNKILYHKFGIHNWNEMCLIMCKKIFDFYNIKNRIRIFRYFILKNIFFGKIKKYYNKKYLFYKDIINNEY